MGTRWRVVLRMKSQKQYNQKLELQVPLLMKVQKKKRKKKKKKIKRRKRLRKKREILPMTLPPLLIPAKTPHPLAKTCTRNSSVEASKAPSTKESHLAPPQKKKETTPASI